MVGWMVRRAGEGFLLIRNSDLLTTCGAANAGPLSPTRLAPHSWRADPWSSNRVSPALEKDRGFVNGAIGIVEIVLCDTPHMRLHGSTYKWKYGRGTPPFELATRLFTLRVRVRNHNSPRPGIESRSGMFVLRSFAPSSWGHQKKVSAMQAKIWISCRKCTFLDIEEGLVVA